MTFNAARTEQLKGCVEKISVKLSPLDWARFLLSKTLATTISRETALTPTNNHRLNFFVEYCLKEVLALPEHQQLQTLTHILSSVAQEESLRFSQLVFVEDAGSNTDWRDPHNPSQTVTEVCKKSISFAVNSVELARFKGEFAQWLRVRSLLAEESPTTALPSLREMGAQFQKLAQTTMSRVGYQPATLQQATQLKIAINKFGIHPETRNWQNEDIWASAPFLYCMPKSAAHPGGMAVLVITQPFFNAQTSKRYLLQTQLLVKLDNEQLVQLFLSLSSSAPEKKSDRSSLEDWLLEQVAKLEEYVQLDHYQLILKQVEKVSKEKIELEPYPEIIVKKYARLFHRLLLKSNPAHGKPSEETLQRLAEFFWQVVFKGLKNPEFIPADEVLEKVYLQYQAAQKTQQQLSTTVLAANGFWPAVLRVSSVSQCVLGTPLSLPTTVLNNSHLLSQTQLAQMIGVERAASWKNGRCRRCGKKTWVGECGLCLECETFLQKKAPAKNLTNANNASHDNTQENTRRLASAHSSSALPRVGLTAFLAGEDKYLIRQQELAHHQSLSH